MALHALSLPRPREAFEPLRTSMSKYLHSPTQSRKIAGKALKKIPKVVYIDRQDTSRRLVGGDHEALLKYLKGLEKGGKIKVFHGEFGKLGLKDQVESVLDADVRLLRILLLSLLHVSLLLSPNLRIFLHHLAAYLVSLPKINTGNERSERRDEREESWSRV